VPSSQEQAAELDAARIALSGTTLERARLAARSLYNLLRDPDDTQQVFLLGLATSRRAFPELLARICIEEEGARLIHEQPAIDSRSVDYAALRMLEGGTLGREYVRFIDDHHLDPDLFQRPPGIPEIPGYVSQRLRQVHDVWHVLTGIRPDVPGEVALQAFTYAQTGAPLSLLIALFGSLRFSLAHPGIAGGAMVAYRRGKRAAFLPVVRVEDMWALPLSEVRARLRIVAETN
jgi:ubiquinone biosynthesis protein COQ4